MARGAFVTTATGATTTGVITTGTTTGATTTGIIASIDESGEGD
jgi:hypothetical protein